MVDRDTKQKRRKQDALTGNRRSRSDMDLAKRLVEDESFRESVLVEAWKLVHGNRGESYGHPSEDFEKTARMWSGILMDELKLGVMIPNWKVALMMICVKLSRECNAHKRDNATDIAGYTETLMMIRGDENG